MPRGIAIEILCRDKKTEKKRKVYERIKLFPYTDEFLCIYAFELKYFNAFLAFVRPAAVDTVKDFLFELGMKPHMHLAEISIFSLKNVTVRPTKIMNRADKNWAHF